MEITITKTNEKYGFTSSNGKVEIPIIASPELSGDANGFRPMELVLSSLGSCLSIDILLILEKQRHVIDFYNVKVSGTRKDEIPSTFDEILVEIHITADIPANKVERAIQLAIEKYCSVYQILQHSANINYKYYLNDEK
ncbi:MAG: putative OsmC-like protein [Parvicella sp.]|jgi:uncharacterized OsmC-like protein